jgi:hypothetical protein
MLMRCVFQLPSDEESTNENKLLPSAVFLSTSEDLVPQTGPKTFPVRLTRQERKFTLAKGGHLSGLLPLPASPSYLPTHNADDNSNPTAHTSSTDKQTTCSVPPASHAPSPAMRRRAGGGAGSPPLPDTLNLVALLLLLLLLLGAAELVTGACSCRALEADAASARKHGGTVLRRGPPPPASATAAAGGAAYDASKRMVPQGPNPLHN